MPADQPAKQAAMLRAMGRLMDEPPSEGVALAGVDLAAMAAIEGTQEWRDPKAKRESKGEMNEHSA